MEFDKLSIGSPMAQGHLEDDLLNADELLKEDAPAEVQRPKPDGRQAETAEMLSPISEGEYCCDYISADIYQHRGVLLQFINQNCADAATIIGGVRLPISDIRLIPAYLARNRQLVKQHAVRQLQRHLVETQSAAGATDLLCLDDYGMTYSLASVSKQARALNPLGKQEGPLLYCMFPRLNAPITLYFNQDGSAEKAHVVNVYIHLYDVNRRRRAIIERAAKAEETRAQAMAAPPLPPPTAVKRKGQVLNQQPAQQAQPASRQNGSANHRAAQTSWQPPLPQPVAQPPPPPVARPPPPPVVEHYPAMPTNQHPINWPMSPRLPDFPGV